MLALSLGQLSGYVLVAVAGFVFGVLFGRKNPKKVEAAVEAGKNLEKKF